MPECFYVNNCSFFELVQQFYHDTEIGNVANANQHLRCSAIADKIKTIVLDIRSGRKVCKKC